MYDVHRHHSQLIGAAGLETLSAVRAEQAPPDWPLSSVIETGEPALAPADLLVLFDAQATREQRRHPRQVLVMPMPSVELDCAPSVLVVGLSPHLALDERYRDFLSLAASQIAAALADAHSNEAQQRRLRALEELDRSKTEFFHNVSHEFRTPLTLMLGPIEDALTRPERALSGESLGAVHRNTLRLLRLVNMLLDFSRLSAGRLDANFTLVDLARLTLDYASAFRSAFERAGVKFTLDCQTLRAPAYVDPELWEKIVLNLLSNALKFTLEGEVSVSLREVAGTAELKVKDTGVGIAAEELPHVFERFHRARNTRARSHEGTGIGLALSRDLAQLHGGTLTVQSELGRGTTFTVRLPLGREHLRAAEQTSVVHQSTLSPRDSMIADALRWDVEAEAPAPASAPADPDTRILVVDDNADMRDYLTRILARHYATLSADNGVQALALAKRDKPDLVLTDVMMPELDGFGLLKALRADETTRAIPVVLLSARAGEDARVEGLQSGADDYLVKPFAARELLARVATHVALGRALQATRAAQERLRAVVEQAPAAVAVLRGPDLVFELANPRAEVLLGRHNLEGKRFRDVFPELASDKLLMKRLEHVRTEGAGWSAAEYRVTLDRGGTGQPEDVYFMFTCQPLREPDGSFDAVLTVAIDVTEEVMLRHRNEALSKELERLFHEEQQARAAAEAANRDKDDFLAMLGHELRNPLAPIATAIELLRQSGPLSRELVIIERQVGHLTRLVEDLLEVSRITRGKIELKRQPVSIAQIVRQAVELANPLLEERAQRLSLELGAPEAQVFGDPTRLAQVLANLLTNAAKYTDRGGHVEVRSRVHADEGTVEIAVRDNGIGIEPSMLEHVFDAFAQESQAIDRSRGGLGLGLTIVRNLVTLHGGSVAAYSGGKGQGSEFSLRLPMLTLATQPTLGANGRALRAQNRGLQGRRVLVVDDNDDAAVLLAEWFRRKGAEVLVENDGMSALEALQKFRPELGVIDIGLPVLNGYDVARRIRRDPSYRNLTLIAVTGYGQSADRAQSASAGFDEHCVKPLDLEHFEDLLGKLLARRSEADLPRAARSASTS